MPEPVETLQDFFPLRRGFPRAEFVESLNHPFLVQTSSPITPGEEKQKKMSFATSKISREDTMDMLGLGKRDMATRRVRKIVKKASQTFQGMVNVGRTDNNDLVLEYSEVSKFHAYFSKDPLGEIYYVTDVGSTNGTFVNGTQLQARVRFRLAEGDMISFGRAEEARFYLPAGFYDLLGLWCGDQP